VAQQVEIGREGDARPNTTRNSSAATASGTTGPTRYCPRATARAAGPRRRRPSGRWSARAGGSPVGSAGRTARRAPRARPRSRPRSSRPSRRSATRSARAQRGAAKPDDHAEPAGTAELLLAAEQRRQHPGPQRAGRDQQRGERRVEPRLRPEDDAVAHADERPRRPRRRQPAAHGPANVAPGGAIGIISAVAAVAHPRRRSRLERDQADLDRSGAAPNSRRSAT